MLLWHGSRVTNFAGILSQVMEMGERDDGKEGRCRRNEMEERLEEREKEHAPSVRV